MDLDLIYNSFMLLAYGAVLVFIIWLVVRRRGLKKGYALFDVARRLNGEVQKDPGSEFPSVQFRLRGLKCSYTCSANPAGEIVTSRVEALVGAPGFFEARARRSRWMPTRFPRAREIHSSQPDYRMLTTDETWTLSQLERGMDPLLADLRTWAPGPASVQLTPARLYAEVESVLDVESAARLAGFVDQLLELFLQRGSEGGVKILQSGLDLVKGRCPICAETLEGQTVLCVSCKTPHHGECWSYTGRCAIYGCRSRVAA